jgi:hypothetical protein
MHSENGCTGATGRGYEINPTRDSDYKIGKTPPSITEVTRMPLVPGDADKVEISARIVDFDGTIASTKLFYSTNMSQTYDQFTEVAMTLKSGTTDTYEAEIPTQTENTVVRYYIFATDDINQESFFPFGANAGTDPDFAFYTVRNGGLTIADIQRVLNVKNDRSPFENQEVTVTGVVTASAKAYDLEQIYIQDPDATEWAGIKCQGNSDLIKLFRGQEVTVTGTVSESFGFTVLNVTDVKTTGEFKEVKIATLDPSDSAFYFSKAAEAYEGMLVGMTNSAGKVYISNPRLNNFGEYMISTDEDATYGRSRRVQAGIQNTNNSSSLWVSIVSDTTLKDNEGAMNLAPIKAEKGMSFDTVVGILYYGFSNYNLLPRNDDDFRGSSVTLPETDYPEYISVPTLEASLQGVTFYPNPAKEVLNIKITNNNVTTLDLEIVGSNGEVIRTMSVENGDVIPMEDLASGMYIIRTSSAQTGTGYTRIIKR